MGESKKDDSPPLPPYYFKIQKKGLWLWFGSDDYHQDYKDNLTLELLKTTYRLKEQTHAREYQLAKQAMEGLEIDLPLTLYQAQNQTEYNAALIYFEDEIAVLIAGNLFELLDDQELLAVFAHELAHHKLYFSQNNDFFRASRILEWVKNKKIIIKLGLKPPAVTAYLLKFMLIKAGF